MAPRKQTKAAESIVADANGDASPSRKRKIAAKPVTEESKQVRTGLRRAKAEKAEINDVVIDASPPKKARGGKSKTAEPKPATETKSGKSNKVAKTEETINNNAHEKAPKQTTEKRARATKTAGAMAKKAGTKEQPATKSKAKESTRKPKNNTAATENGAGGNAAEMDVAATSTKRTRGKVMEKENAMPARTATAAKAPKKRKNVEEETIGNAEVVEEEAAVAVPDKKPRGKPKKATAQAGNEPEVKPKGRPKKTAKAEPTKTLLKNIEEEEDEENVLNTAEQEDNSKTDSTKNTKKGNTKKAAPKGKRNAAPEKADDAQVDEAAVAEADVQENGKIENVQSKQQKKRNVGKANAATKEKAETKGRQKKGQAAAAGDEKEIAKDASAEDDAAKKVNTVSEAQDESDANEVAQSDNAPNKKEAKGEADQAELPESVDSAQPIKNEILENEANTLTNKDEN